MPLRDNRAEMATFSFGDEADAERTMTLIGKASDLPMVTIPARSPRPGPLNLMTFWFHGTRQSPPGRAQIDPSAERLFVDYPDSAPLTLELGPMFGEYARLDACAQELYDGWGRTASAAADPVSEPQILDGQEFMRRLWFPPNLSMNRISGVVQLRMTVDASGRARNCVVQGWTGARQFGEQSCETLERWARFEPAKNAQGDPVNALFRTSIMFVIYEW